jgi:integrase
MAGKKGMRLRTWGTLRRLPSGKWQASYVGPDLGRHVAQMTYTAKMDAEHWLSDERRLIERNEWTAPRLRAEADRARSKTLGEYTTDWLETRTLKPRTKIGYEASYNNFIRDKLGNVTLSALNAETVRRWYSAMDKTKPTARAHAYQLLHAVCATALTDGLLTANPCNLPRAMSAPTQKQTTILGVDDIAKLANSIEPQRFKSLVLVAAWCGLRFGEVVELRRKDIGLDGAIVTVARAVTHRKGECHPDTTKTGKGRTVVVPPHIRQDLMDHLEHNVGDKPDSLLFPPVRGGCHLDNKVFSDSYFKPALTAIGREGVTPHGLRHFAGTQTARVGNLVETMGRLGHSTVKASLIYQQIVSGRDAEVADALSDVVAVRFGCRRLGPTGWVRLAV